MALAGACYRRADAHAETKDRLLRCTDSACGPMMVPISSCGCIKCRLERKKSRSICASGAVTMALALSFHQPAREQGRNFHNTNVLSMTVGGHAHSEQPPFAARSHSRRIFEAPHPGFAQQMRYEQMRWHAQIV